MKLLDLSLFICCLYGRLCVIFRHFRRPCLGLRNFGSESHLDLDVSVLSSNTKEVFVLNAAYSTFLQSSGNICPHRHCLAENEEHLQFYSLQTEQISSRGEEKNKLSPTLIKSAIVGVFIYFLFFPHLFLPHNIYTVFRNEQTQCSIEH